MDIQGIIKHSYPKNYIYWKTIPDIQLKNKCIKYINIKLPYSPKSIQDKMYIYSKLYNQYKNNWIYI